MYKKNKVCIVVPAHNEEEFVCAVIKTVPAYADWVVVVDDASTDATLNEAKKAAGKLLNKRIFLIRHEKNQGVGGAIISGHKKALELGADFSVVMAGDGQMPPGHAPQPLFPLTGGGEHAEGKRGFE